ncbi:MAG: non-heme iron oxygenase ferredoxin subunit [Actinomycetia bacterium]|nr:non-heme iron oxygenase ferredoxin subunit [Actinomycetes bacterium]
MSGPSTTEVRVGAVVDFPAGQATKVAVGGCPVAVVRIGDDFYALGDTCSHADVSLSEGAVEADELILECWRHGAQFRLNDGVAVTLPATRPVPVYDIRVDGDDVFVTITQEG